MEGFNKVIEIGYADLSNLLEFREPIAYTSGVYGWNANVYDMGSGVAIVTGYRAFGNTSVDYDKVREYDQKARQLRTELRWEYVKEETEKLIDEFLGEVAK